MFKKSTILLFCVLAKVVSAQWNANLTLNTPICVAAKNQDNLHSVTDGKGGAVMVWGDNRNPITYNKDIYVQRITKGGILKWATDGIAICTNTATQSSSAITDAGNGNVIITWEDNRTGSYDIYAQKIDSLGNLLWQVDGIVVCSKSNNQKNPKIISDNAGGAIIVWEDSVGFYYDVYAQKINASGSLSWGASGVGVSIASNSQINPRIEIDGVGGAFVTWQDKRNNIDYDIYAQHLTGAGAVTWTANGIAICSFANTQANPRIEPDGAGGAIIGWIDKRNGIDNNIYAQRLNAVGASQWAAGGVVVCNAANNQSALDFKYLGSGGMVFAWKDERSNTIAIYSQMVSLTGAPLLTANGILISNSLKALNPNVIGDENGGAIIAWEDSVGNSWNIKSQKLNASGVIQWSSGGTTVSMAVENQTNVGQVSDNSGGAIYAWQDHRNGTNDDIYSHRLLTNGITANNKETMVLDFISAVCFPNPINNNSVIRVGEINGAWNLHIFNAFGKLIISQYIDSGNIFALSNLISNAGVYFYTVNPGNSNKIIKGSFINSNTN